MRILSLALLALAILSGYGAFVFAASVDLQPLTDEGRVAAQMAFNALAGAALVLPALSALAWHETKQRTR